MNSVATHPQASVVNLLSQAELKKSLSPVIEAIEFCLESGIDHNPIVNWWRALKQPTAYHCNGVQFIDLLCKLTSPFCIHRNKLWYEISDTDRRVEIERLKNWSSRKNQVVSESQITIDMEHLNQMLSLMAELNVKRRLFELENLDVLRSIKSFRSAHPFVHILNDLYPETESPAVVINDWIEDLFDPDFSDAKANVHLFPRSSTPELYRILKEWFDVVHFENLKPAEKDIVQFLLNNDLHELENEENWAKYVDWVSAAAKLNTVCQPVYVLFLNSIADLSEVFNANFHTPVHEYHELIAHIALSPRFSYEESERSRWHLESKQETLEAASRCELSPLTLSEINDFVNDKSQSDAFFPPQYLGVIYSLLFRWKSFFDHHILSIPAYCTNRLVGRAFFQLTDSPGKQMFYDIDGLLESHKEAWKGHLPTEFMRLMNEFRDDNEMWSDKPRADDYIFAINACLRDKEFELANAALSFFIVSEACLQKGQLGGEQQWEQITSLVDELRAKAGFDMTLVALEAARRIAEYFGERRWVRKIRNLLPPNLPQLPKEWDPAESKIVPLNPPPKLKLIDTAEIELSDCIGAERLKAISALGKKILLDVFVQILQQQRENFSDIIRTEKSHIIMQFRKFFEVELRNRLGTLVAKHWVELQGVNERLKNLDELTGNNYVHIILDSQKAPSFYGELKEIIDLQSDQVWKDLRRWILNRGNSAAHSATLNYAEALVVFLELAYEEKLLSRFIDSLYVTGLNPAPGKLS